MPQPTHSTGRPPVMTSGLVVTLTPGASLDALDSVFTVGERVGDRLAVALEAEDADASERWTEWLRRSSGVLGVEVVFVHWDVEEEVTHDGT